MAKIRALVDANHKDYDYTVVEYNLSDGSWIQRIVNCSKTNMRMGKKKNTETAKKRRLEMQAASNLGWKVITEEQFNGQMEWFTQRRLEKGYTGAYPQPGEIFVDSAIHSDR